ncbi:LOW QUALITY PROTEIN: putative Ribosomal L29 protein [Leishmania utingensis]|uniref:Ribosomal L29 protein n=1 Tax=Leishmania utingensis TaxID=653362 RepID=A0AAW3AD48_9TRYP
MSHHMKIKDLREKSKDDLLKKLTEYKKELSQLRVVQQTGGAEARLGRIRPIRKSIARILTVLNQNERQNLKKFYSDGKMHSKMPKVLRAIRKSIARILTVLNQNERQNLKKFYSDGKMHSKMPKVLRAKLTHRRRLALKDNEKNRKTLHQLRQAHKYPKRVYAVRI